MYENISIKLHPYLGRSKNLMEFFVIIGYEEELLTEKFSDNLNNEELEITVISSVISDLAYAVFDPDLIIKQIYPNKPDIIKIQKSESPPGPSSVLFYSCFDSLDGKSKVLYSCYALRFYEKFTFSNSSYYIPKAILIFSQYPYFTTYFNICNTFYKNLFNKDENKNIPIEILIYCLVNYVPSPINDNIILKLYQNNINFIPKLTAYPYVDFDLNKIFNLIPINEFIKIYILTFIEITLLFFSPNLVKLNIFMYVLNILNYPMIDSHYHWHIKSISENELKFGEDAMNPTFRGVNCTFNSNLDFSNYKNLNFIFDMVNKCIKCISKNENKEANELNLLLKYITNILNNKKVDSSFLSENIIILRDKIVKIKNDYDKEKINTYTTFFYVNKKITHFNKLIQEAFYDFVLNTLIVIYKDYKLNEKCTEIIKKIDEKSNLSKEETIFIKYFRNSIKYNTYFENFLQNFSAVDELKVSFVFSDEYIHLKINDDNKKIPEKINYFQIMDNFYSLKPQDIVFNFNTLIKGFNESLRRSKFKNYVREFESQLVKFDKNLIKIFLFMKKNRNDFQDLKLKEKMTMTKNIESIEKISIIFSIQSYFYKVLSRSYFYRGSVIYIFSIVFPLFPKELVTNFLKEVLYNLNKTSFFHRYYVYILLKSIHKYYLVNLENRHFPELTFENVKSYCSLIKDYLIKRSFIPNEETFLFLKDVLSDDSILIKNEKKIKNNKTNFIFEFEKEENYAKYAPKDIIIKDQINENFLLFNYKDIKQKIEFVKDVPMILQQTFSTYDSFFLGNFNIENFDNKNLIDSIINIIFYFNNIKNEEVLNTFLLNSIILLKKLENDLSVYKKNNKDNNNDNKNNINENNNINNNKDNNKDNKYNINNENNNINENNINNNKDNENNDIINIQEDNFK